MLLFFPLFEYVCMHKSNLHTHTHTHAHEHTLMLCRYLASDKLLTHLSGCQCLESNYPTLFTQGALTQLSPSRDYIEGVLLLTTLSWTPTYTCMHTHLWALTPAHTRTQTCNCVHSFGLITDILITELYSCGAQQTQQQVGRSRGP